MIRPRATEDALIGFEEAARQATLDVARETGSAVIDVAHRLNGRRQWFVSDFVHFNDEGAAEVAQMIADRVVDEQRQRALSR